MTLTSTFGTRVGTLGGTVLTVAINISSGDLIRTAILAAFGALVSFSVSMVLKLVIRWLTRKPPGIKGS